MTPIWIAIGAMGAPILVGLGAAGASVLERLREARRHRRLVEGLGAPGSPDVTPKTAVTLEGTLVGEGPAVTFHPYGASFLEEPNVYAVSHVPRLAVQLKDGSRALLEGDAQVVVGSMETEHKAPLERANELDAKELASAKVKTRVGQFRTVRANDRVRVHGLVEPAPDDEALYRERSRAFRLLPAPPESPGVPAAIPIAATGKVERRRLGGSGSRIAILAVALGSGLASAGLLSLQKEPTTVASLSGPALPPGPPPCRQAILDNGDPSIPCDDLYARAVARYIAGDFKGASIVFKDAVAQDGTIPPSLSEAEAHLFAHDYPAATDTVDRMLHIYYPGPSTAEKRDLECVRELLRAGEGGATGTGWDHKRYRKICSMRPFAKLARELDAVGGFDGEDHDELWKEYINGNYLLPAAKDPLVEPRNAAFGTRARLLARPVGVEARVIDKLGLEPSGYGKLVSFGVQTSAEDYFKFTTPFAAEIALFYAFSGFPDRAAHYWPMLDRVADVTSTHKHFHEVRGKYDEPMIEEERLLLESVMSIASAAAIFAGDNARAIRYGKLGEPHSGHCAIQLERMLRPGAPWEEPDEDGHWPPHAEIFQAGLTGDGQNVARVLTQQRVTGRETLARVLPLITTNKASLVGWFHSPSYPAPCVTCGASSFHGHLSDRHEVARLLGEKDDGKALEAFTNALVDPVIAFDIDELETFFNRKQLSTH